MIRCQSFEDYLDAVREQVRKHGTKALKGKDFIESWEFRVGFESVRSYFPKSEFERVEPPSLAPSASPAPLEFGRCQDNGGSYAGAIAEGVRARSIPLVVH